MEREIRQTETFRSWLEALKDQKAVQAIRRRLLLMAAGSLGDAEPIGQGVSEARIHYGPGYRLYFVQRGPVIIILLCGGTKRTQKGDMKTARYIADNLED